jgi:signal transduction histidine kinase
VVESAGTAVLLALENARLEAEVRSSARELRASRARILAAGMSERRRLERNLHDTAQQRLVMLRVKLDLAEQRSGTEAADLRRLLRRLGDDVEATIEGLREVAHGLYPLLLEEQGLEFALRREVRTAARPPALVVGDIGRSRPDVEAAAYVCCRDALALLDGEVGPDADLELALDVRQSWLRIHLSGDSSTAATNLAERVAAEMRDPAATPGGRADAAAGRRARWSATAYVPWPPVEDASA